MKKQIYLVSHEKLTLLCHSQLNRGVLIANLQYFKFQSVISSDSRQAKMEISDYNGTL